MENASPSSLPKAAGGGSSSTADPSEKPRFSVRRLLPIMLIAAGFVAFFAFGLDDLITFEALKAHREVLMDWTGGHFFLASVAFIGGYVAVVALSLPVAVLLTPIAGFLFGTWLGALYSLLAATLGATVVFLAARYAFAALVEAKAGPWLRKMEAGFRADAFNYMLVLRLVPLFPFWLVNLVPAVLGVRLGTYVLGTALGMVPGAVVYAGVGAGLGTVFAAGGTPDLAIVFEPQVLLPLLGLSALSLMPVAYKKWRKA